MKQQLNINNSRPKKSLGQNFIINEKFLQKLSSFIYTDENTTIIEIGPGRGALTNYLVKKKFKSLILIEKDIMLSQDLLKKYENNKKIVIKNLDALNVNYEKLNLKKNVIIVGNLPFNISTQLLFKWLDQKKWPPFYDRMILMFQKEVASRIIAKHNNKNYGKLSVACQVRCDIEKLLIAKPDIFSPPPKVHGVVLDFRPSLKYKDLDYSKLKNILTLAFSKRRKKIKTNLSDYKDALINLKINENLRAENLSVLDYCKLLYET